MATTPASVGVKIPRRTPPMMITGRHRGRIACFTIDNACPAEILSLLASLYPRLLLMKDTKIMRDKHRSRLGPMPAIKSFPMETLAIEP